MVGVLYYDMALLEVANKLLIGSVAPIPATCTSVYSCLDCGQGSCLVVSKRTHEIKDVTASLE